MEQHIAFVEQMVAQGGPKPVEYDSFTNWLHTLSSELRDGKLTEHDIQSVRSAFGEALSSETMQGHALNKPHGYAGDYEMIEKLYQYHISDNPYLENWDRYLQAQAAPIAVRNRKEYFKQILRRLAATNQGERPLRVLNVASGPARDVFEFLCEQNGRASANINFDCIDLDLDAIDYARDLCAEFQEQLSFTHANALRFTTAQRYQLIWSSGLFDYFRDSTFKCALKRLLKFLDKDGDLVIGNVTENNPTRDYLEIIGDWHMYHRTAEDLISLALDSGLGREEIRIEKEPEGVIQFLHVKRGGGFITD